VNSPDWKRLWNLLLFAFAHRLMMHLMIYLRRDLNNLQQPFRSWVPCSTVGGFAMTVVIYAADVSRLIQSRRDSMKGRDKVAEQFFD
jgi:hypothetical protein